MVWMWIVVAVVVVIAVVAFVATFIRRPRGDDLNSVRNYHSALGTLEHLSERTSQQSVNVTGPAEAARRLARTPQVLQPVRSRGGSASAGASGDDRVGSTCSGARNR